MKNQRISRKGIKLVKEFEGWRAEPYWDALGQVWTQGWGHTANVSRHDAPWTLEQGEAMLLQDLAESESIVNSLNLVLTQNQFDALVSFVFNVGPGQEGVKDGLIWLKSGGTSTMLRYLRDQRYRAAADEFLKWANAGGQRVAGLVRRREAERALFLGLDDSSDAQSPQPSPAPSPDAQNSPASDLDPSNPTIVERVMAVPALLIPAAIQALTSLVPALGKLFSSGSPVAERNIKAAELVIDAATKAAGAVNTQELIEKVEARDPQVVQAVTVAVQQTMELVEVGGGIAAARQAAKENPAFIPIMRNVSYAALGFLVLANALVGVMVAAFLNGTVIPGWEQLLGIVLQADIGIAMVATSFWLGSSLAKPRLQEGDPTSGGR